MAGDKSKSGRGGGRGERFAGAMDPAAAALNASVGFDRRLLRDDVRGSQAQARMLAAVGLIAAAEADAIVAGLETVAGEIEQGTHALDPALEDIHMNVEARLIELIGEPGRRLHTARSRNDQVATDLKLYARAAAIELAAAIDRVRLALVRRASEHADTLLPGYTHLQRAQAVTLGHHLLAYAEMLGRDRGRLLDGARRAGQSPLGSGALAATGLPIDRARTANDLGFDEPTHNSLDAVSDRDFAVELVFACAMIGVHLSRLGEELVLWSTTEFGFVRLAEGYCSGSSLMPQKRNPDIAELLRAKPARVIGDLVTLLAVNKGLPLAYNKDLQETQEPLYDGVETARLSLAVAAGLVAGLEFNVERMREAAADPALGATDLAEQLVRGGMPFRTAHELCGRLVKHAEAKGVSLRALGADDLRTVDASLTPALLDALDPARAVAARTVVGGPAPEAVRREIARLAAELKALGFDV
jgi:argininosuccinate lyase